MKKNIIAIVLTSFLFVLSLTITAQTTAPADSGTTPEDPGGDPSGTDPLGPGGGAPIGGGTFILMALGAAYAGKKGYTLYKDNQAELED
jgi:hypothetical protein